MNYANYNAPFMRYYNPVQNVPMPQQPMPEYPTMGQGMGQPMGQTMGQGDLLWVLNENEAASYPVGMNNTVTLWDKNLPTIYVKSVDARGVPSMRVLDFTERTATPSQRPQDHVCHCGDKYVSKEQYNELKGFYDDLNGKYQSLAEKIDSIVPKSPKKKEGASE